MTLMGLQKEFGILTSWEKLGEVTLDQFLLLVYAFKELNKSNEDEDTTADQPDIDDEEILSPDQSRAQYLLSQIPQEMHPSPPSTGSGRMVVVDDPETVEMVRAIKARAKARKRAERQRQSNGGA